MLLGVAPLGHFKALKALAETSTSAAAENYPRTINSRLKLALKAFHSPPIVCSKS